MSRHVDPERRAARFIALEEHESTHDRLVWGMRRNRDEEVARVPEWEKLRELASQIKEHTLTHLDRYLEQFEGNATRRGMHVHWARDAEEHNSVVYQILRAHQVRSLIKSKSMLQEECGMTPYLKKRGIEVTESDLGERIQQLSDEPPSHIVVPAIHKLRSDVATLFAREIDSDPSNSDPHYLAEAMRGNARPRFLAAQAAMTGANFAVAETGGFVVCTNEGNADIGASVPPLHIASIGIEKLIPRARDLGVFVRMLSRSALGSAITQYTSHFHGPRQGGELHIVLVDNTRSDRLGSPDFWHGLKCIRCGACMNTCPVYRRAGGLSYGGTYSGPIGVILEPGFDIERFRELPFHSSLCGSCTEVCPVKIDISDQIYKWRRVVAEKGLVKLTKKVGMSALGTTLAHPSLFHSAESLAESALEHAPRFLLYNPLNAWGRHRELPAAPARTFRQWYRENRGNHGSA
ncbi:MAG TPA: 4Fe-4S ferredoxin [Deltaproteobacteria bacterium]|jgi:L-lactate dehydrogenase complex protein LldF|nr:4Fe-4S ferredoxin [Deltaproteobacteria bacterium]